MKLKPFSHLFQHCWVCACAVISLSMTHHVRIQSNNHSCSLGMNTRPVVKMLMMCWNRLPTPEVNIVQHHSTKIERMFKQILKPFSRAPCLRTDCTLSECSIDERLLVLGANCTLFHSLLLDSVSQNYWNIGVFCFTYIRRLRFKIVTNILKKERTNGQSKILQNYV